MKETLNFPINKKITILSLGAESAGRFAVYENSNIFVSKNFGDILDENNFKTFKKAVLRQVKIKKPNVILTDLHPLYNSTVFGEKLSKKLKVPHIKVQHHIAHIFSAVGDYIINSKFKIQNSKFDFIGIASDGTGYGFDENIWGGEVFKVKNANIKMENYKLKLKNNKCQNLNVTRIGSLEEQTMIGGDLAVKEPARMLIIILSKFLSKEKVYANVKKFYTKNDFELLFAQLEQNFNCQKTTSTGRILDAVSVLLGFAKNERRSKHEATKLLEKNSTIPYKNYELRIKNYELQKVLDTTYFFEYLLKNIDKDKRRLAATAQEYLAKGFYEIAKEAKIPVRSLASTYKNIPNTQYCIPNTFLAGGLSNNKVISSYLKNKGVYTSKKIPHGDEGIAFGQIMYYLYL